MLVFARRSGVGPTPVVQSDEEATLLRIEERLPPLLSVIAGMVDLTGFFMLGNIFTAHITGNLVTASAVAVRGGPMNAAQLMAIPVFIVALAGLLQGSPIEKAPHSCSYCSWCNFSCLRPCWYSASLQNLRAIPMGSLPASPLLSPFPPWRVSMRCFAWRYQERSPRPL
jgi:hypothetical protein